MSSSPLLTKLTKKNHRLRGKYIVLVNIILEKVLRNIFLNPLESMIIQEIFQKIDVQVS